MRHPRRLLSWVSAGALVLVLSFGGFGHDHSSSTPDPAPGEALTQTWEQAPPGLTEDQRIDWALEQVLCQSDAGTFTGLDCNPATIGR